MKIKNYITSCFLVCLCFFPAITTAEIKQTELLNNFINNMVQKHQFKKAELESLFKAVDIKQNILDTISSPAEGLPWHKYRKIFLTDSRIDGGVKFWQKHQQVLAAVEQEYGIPAEIIVAIIGVETRYGTQTGHHRVIDALSTLAFAYPKRSKFFTSELENFLLLCRSEQIDPIQPTGSYAGAMGIPQFMPSSFLSYAADFEQDQHKDIWNNPADAIASVANYFARHHWQAGQAIAFPVTATDQQYKSVLNKELKPDLTLAQLSNLNINLPEQLLDTDKLKLLAFEQETGDELWLGLNNFYVITRYNHSPLYAMAVFQLSQAIADKKTQ